MREGVKVAKEMEVLSWGPYGPRFACTCGAVYVLLRDESYKNCLFCKRQVNIKDLRSKSLKKVLNEEAS